MKLTQAINQRYSCRSYSSKKIPKKVILDLLKLANQAPSAGNKQNRQFIVITDEKNRQYLKQMNNQSYFAEAPVVILVCSKLPRETTVEYLNSLEKWELTVKGVQPKDIEITQKFENDLKEMRYKWMVSDAAAAVENLLLAATEKGLATCWVGIMDFQGVINRFNLPKDMLPICLVTLGYAKKPPSYRAERKPIGKLVHWETYQKK